MSKYRRVWFLRHTKSNRYLSIPVVHRAQTEHCHAWNYRCYRWNYCYHCYGNSAAGSQPVKNFL